MDDRIVKISIGLVISIILVTAVAVPILGSITEDINTVQDNPDTKFMMNRGTTDITIEFTDVSKGQYKVNGNARASLGSSWEDSEIIIWDDGGIRIYSGGAMAMLQKDQGCGISISNGNTITFIDGTWTFTGSSTFTGSYTFLLYPDDNGTYGEYIRTTHGEDKNAEIFVIKGNANKNDTPAAKDLVIVAHGTPDKMQANVWSYAQNGTVVNQPEQTLKPIVETDNGISLELKNYGYSWDGVDTYTEGHIIAPIEYHILTSEDNAINSLIHIIPLLLVIALLVGVVGTVIVKKYSN